MNCRGWMMGILLLCLPVWATGDSLELQRNFLGETLTLRMEATPANNREELAQQLDAEIDRLDAMLIDVHKPGASSQVDFQQREWHSLLQACEHWRKQLSPHFSCRQGAIWKTWQEAVESGQLPDRTQLRRLARSLDETPFTDDAADWQWAPQDIVQGWALEHVRIWLQQQWPGVSVTHLQLGKRLVVQTSSELPIAVDALSDAFQGHGSIVLDKGALALGGGKKSDWLIGNRRFSQAINPAEGWSSLQVLHVLVVAPDAISAQALASALAYMPISEGLALVNRLVNTEALLVTESGKFFPSEGWYSLLVPDERHQPLWNAQRQFLIEYDIPAHQVAEYRRPYAAIWITDEQQQVIRQLLVHGRNLRWLREIPLWWRRHGRRDESMVDGLSRATPQPGRHLLVWDGRDDKGDAVPEGHYLLHIEVAREHGERELLSVPFVLSGADFELKKQGKTELGWVKVSLHPTVD